MLAARITLALALTVGFTVLAAAQVLGTTPVETPDGPRLAPNLRIVSPRNNQKLAVDYVRVRYEIINPAASANTLPTFQVQLDGSDPIRTSSTDHTFTGLAPGAHTISVELVDANNIPVTGTRTEVQFMVAGAGAGASQSPTSMRRERKEGSHLVTAALDQQTADRASSSGTTPSSDDDLPPAGSALPFLSIIGFGVLVGGIASALKTR